MQAPSLFLGQLPATLNVSLTRFVNLLHWKPYFQWLFGSLHYNILAVWFCKRILFSHVNIQRCTGMLVKPVSRSFILSRRTSLLLCKLWKIVFLTISVWYTNALKVKNLAQYKLFIPRSTSIRRKTLFIKWLLELCKLLCETKIN